MRLKEFITELERFPEDLPLFINFPGYWKDLNGNTLMVPGEFHCWRGSYCDLALSPETWDRTAPHHHIRGIYVTVGDILEKTKNAIGATFEGYKGSDYTMSEESALWIAAHEGDSSSNIPVRIQVDVNPVTDYPMAVIEIMNIGEYH